MSRAPGSRPRRPSCQQRRRATEAKVRAQADFLVKRLLQGPAGGSLDRPGRAGIEAIVRRLVGGAALSPDIAEAMVARTDGMPLFVEELTKTMVEHSAAGEQSVPASLHDTDMARLGRVPGVKESTRIAA